MNQYFLIKNLKYFFGILLLTTLMACCNEQKKESHNTPVDKGSNIGKKFNVPDTIEVYSPFKKYLLDSGQLARHQSLKIYSYVNVSCPTCIEGIDEWEKLVPIFMKRKIPIILICHSKDNFEFIKHLCETAKIKEFSFPFYLDIKNQFYRKNPFLEQSIPDQTMLTDADNTILVTGNPNNSKKLMELYLTEIDKKL